MTARLGPTGSAQPLDHASVRAQSVRMGISSAKSGSSENEPTVCEPQVTVQRPAEKRAVTAESGSPASRRALGDRAEEAGVGSQTIGGERAVAGASSVKLVSPWNGL